MTNTTPNGETPATPIYDRTVEQAPVTRAETVDGRDVTDRRELDDRRDIDDRRDPIDRRESVDRRDPSERRETTSTLRQDVVAREKEEFGGFKFGAAFFGWLTATGTAVLLTALVSATGAAIGLGANGGNSDQAVSSAEQNAATVGLAGAIALAVILLIAYFAGGYVAGRMARFSAVKQGLAVWIWALVIAIIVAIVTAIAGSQFDILANLNSFPRIPLGEGTLTLTGVITAVALVIISLVGAILGSIVGIRYHRKIDRVGFGE